MSYNYKETVDEIVIDKGIATREMWKDYPDGDEFADYAELERALTLRNRAPLVLDSQHDHRNPLRDASKAIGYADLRACPEKKGLSTTWHLWKRALPEWLLALIRRRQPLPVSIFQFTNVDEGHHQRDILIDHIAILTESEPRCPLPRCGVGVYDATMSDQEAPKPEAKKEPVTEPLSQAVSPKAPTTEKPADTKVLPQPPIVHASASEVLPPHAVQEIAALKEELTKTQAQLNAIRQPLVEELVNRGFADTELSPLTVDALSRMVSLARQAQTQGLPGTVPKPPVIPKSKAEQREEAASKAAQEDKERQAKRWAGM
jgi:hypothetical protein